MRKGSKSKTPPPEDIVAAPMTLATLLAALERPGSSSEYETARSAFGREAHRRPARQ